MFYKISLLQGIFDDNFSKSDIIYDFYHVLNDIIRAWLFLKIHRDLIIKRRRTFEPKLICLVNNSTKYPLKGHQRIIYPYYVKNKKVKKKHDRFFALLSYFSHVNARKFCLLIILI